MSNTNKLIKARDLMGVYCKEREPLLFKCGVSLIIVRTGLINKVLHDAYRV